MVLAEVLKAPIETMRAEYGNRVDSKLTAGPLKTPAGSWECFEGVGNTWKYHLVHLREAQLRLFLETKSFTHSHSLPHSLFLSVSFCFMCKLDMIDSSCNIYI